MLLPALLPRMQYGPDTYVFKWEANGIHLSEKGPAVYQEDKGNYTCRVTLGDAPQAQCLFKVDGYIEMYFLAQELPSMPTVLLLLKQSSNIHCAQLY